MPSTRYRDEHPIPKALEKVAERKLSGYKMGMQREKTLEAIARVYHVLVTDFDDLTTHGPHAIVPPAAAYSIPRSEWRELCQDMKVYGGSADAVETVMESAVTRLSANDTDDTKHTILNEKARDDRVPIIVFSAESDEDADAESDS